MFKRKRSTGEAEQIPGPSRQENRGKRQKTMTAVQRDDMKLEIAANKAKFKLENGASLMVYIFHVNMIALKESVSKPHNT